MMSIISNPQGTWRYFSGPRLERLRGLNAGARRRGKPPARYGFLCRLLFALLAAAVPAARGQELGLRAEADRDRIYIGESFILRIMLSGSNASEQPQFPALKDCDIRFLGSEDTSRSSIIIINGKITRESFSGRTFNYQITPHTAGRFSIGTVTLSAGGRTLAAEGPAVFVVDVEKQDRVLLSVESSRSEVLLDEQFHITLKIRIRALPPPHASVQPLFPSMPPALSAQFLAPEPIAGLQPAAPVTEILSGHLERDERRPAFHINEYETESGRDPFSRFGFGSFFSDRVKARFALPFAQAASDDGTTYFEYSLTFRYTPTEEGNYNFGPVLFKGKVPVRVDANGSAEAADIFAVGPACTVRVVPPPEEGRPKSFIGTLGTNMFAEVRLDAAECKAGDPLRLTLSIGGNVRLDKINLPRLSELEGIATNFVVYEETMQAERKPNRNEYVYTVRPIHAGDISLPQIELSYYDTAARQYRTVATSPVPLKVRESEQITAEQIVGAAPPPALSAEEKAAAAEPAPFKFGPAPPGASALSAPPWAWGLAGASPFVFFALRLALFLSERRRRNAALLRKRNALKTALAALGRQQSAAPADATAAARGVCGVLRRYLGDAFNVPEAGLTPEDAKKLLASAPEVPAEISARFVELFDRLFCCAYAAGAGAETEAGADTATQAAAILKALHASLLTGAETAGRGPANSDHTAALLLVFLLLSTAAARAAQSGPAFLREEADAAAAAAKTPSDFEKAAETYRKLAERGGGDGIVFYNMGTALLRAGRHAEAMQAFFRAERYLGAEPQLRHNMRIAGADPAVTEAGDASPWRRIFLFWHYALPSRIRAAATLCAFAAFWLALAARLLFSGLRRPLNRIAVIAAIVFFACSASALTSIIQEKQASMRPAVLLQLPAEHAAETP